MKTTTTLALAASILAVQANAILFELYPEDPNIRPINVPPAPLAVIDTADHRHGFLNSISAQKHTMVATGVGGCFDEPGKPCVQKSGGVITVAVVAPYDDPEPPSSSWVIGGDADDGDGGPLGDDFSGDGFSDNNTDAAGAGGIGSI